MKNLLEIQNLDAGYGKIQVLRNISLTIEEGEIACLIGANGAGKSTLLKTIVGLLPISNGLIQFDQNTITGTNVSDQSWLKNLIHRGQSNTLKIHEIVKQGISLVPEGRRVFSDLTILENLEMGAFQKTDKSYLNRKIDEMFTLFPILKERQQQNAGSLSGGEQQMLAIARALMNSPRLLLLDEPGLGLSPIMIQKIFDSILKINREDQVTVFFVEQNAKTALTISQHGYVMENGCITLKDESSALLANEKVKAAYLGE